MASFTDINSLKSHPDVAMALGEMVIAWANAETAIMFSMCAVCGVSTDMAHFGYYRIPTFEARVKFITAMIPQWETTRYNKEAIAKAIDQISGLSLTRNNWVHGVWSEDNTTKGLVVFNFRARENKGRNKPVKAHDINDHTRKLVEYTASLRGLIPDIP